MGFFDIFFRHGYSKILDRIFRIETNATGFNLVNVNETVNKRIEWGDVMDVYFSEDTKSVYVQKYKGKKIHIPDTYSDWPQFLKAIPLHYNNFDRKKVDLFFKLLAGCKVCGLKAMYNKQCAHCGHEPYIKEQDIEYQDEQEYSRAMQLEYFDVIAEPDEDTVFEKYAEWKALITDEDIAKKMDNPRE